LGVLSRKSSAKESIPGGKSPNLNSRISFFEGDISIKTLADCGEEQKQ